MIWRVMASANTDSSSGRPDVHPLDRRGARVTAIAVAAVMVASLVYIHRDDLMAGPTADSADAPTGALAACLEARLGAVDQMIADRVIGPDKASLFKDRAQALCHAQNPR